MCVRERDLDAFLRWKMKKCSRSQLSLQSLGLKRLFCQSGDLSNSGIDALPNERLLSRAWRKKHTNHDLVGGQKSQIVF